MKKSNLDRRRRTLLDKLNLVRKQLSELKKQEAARRPVAESGKRGKKPMPKPQNKQAIIATVKRNNCEMTGIYWRRKCGGWKREFFVVDKSNDHIPWRRVMSWRKLSNI